MNLYKITWNTLEFKEKGHKLNDLITFLQKYNLKNSNGSQIIIQPKAIVEKGIILEELINKFNVLSFKIKKFTWN